jgi:hypothetical protein
MALEKLSFTLRMADGNCLIKPSGSPSCFFLNTDFIETTENHAHGGGRSQTPNG